MSKVGETMKEFPKGGLIGKVMDAAKTVKQMHIPLHAALGHELGSVIAFIELLGPDVMGTEETFGYDVNLEIQ